MTLDEIRYAADRIRTHGECSYADRLAVATMLLVALPVVEAVAWLRTHEQVHESTARNIADVREALAVFERTVGELKP